MTNDKVTSTYDSLLDNFFSAKAHLNNVMSAYTELGGCNGDKEKAEQIKRYAYAICQRIDHLIQMHKYYFNNG